VSKAKKLTKRQLAVLDDLFTGNATEKTVLKKHDVPQGLYEQWLADERFAQQLQQRFTAAYRQSRIILARKAPQAATKLVKLTTCKKEETARKACLDIISLNTSSSRKVPEVQPLAKDSAPAPELSPEAASRLLATVAEKTEPQQ
jgi:hypothetical protein